MGVRSGSRTHPWPFMRHVPFRPQDSTRRSGPIFRKTACVPLTFGLPPRCARPTRTEASSIGMTRPSRRRRSQSGKLPPQAGQAILDGSTRKGMEQLSQMWTVFSAARSA